MGCCNTPVTGEQLGRPPTGTAMVFVDHLGRVRKAKASVAGFDLTFSVPKSVSVAWALADEPTRAAIHAAHQRALQAVIAYGESQVFATRTGSRGSDHRGTCAGWSPLHSTTSRREAAAASPKWLRKAVH